MLSVAFIALLQATTPAESIRWEPWSGTADGRTINGELGRLRVPQDRSAPTGATIDLAFVRLRATTPTPGAPIIYLAGGPGDSGIESLRVTSTRLLADSLLATGDVIFLDQRGTGRTEPSLRCPPGLPPKDLFRNEATFRGGLRDGMRRCAAAWRERGVNPAHYTVSASAADVDAIRRALGVERVRLVGFSYGTHLGLAVVRQYGRGVERAVLAGVEGPDDNEKLPLVLDQNLARMAAALRADTLLGRLAPDLVAIYDTALIRLRQTPATLRVPNPLTRGDTVDIVVGAFGFQHIVARDLGDTHDWPLLPGLIIRTAHGDYGLLGQFARRRWGGLPSLMWAATDCSSGSSRERSSEAARQAAVSRFSSAMNFGDATLCRAIGATDLGDAFRAPITSPVPTLFVSGALDSQTPPYQADRVRWGFASSAHVVVENAGHESTLDVPAVLSTIAQFMRGEPVRSQYVGIALPAFRGPGRQ
jgi:pimeloyl-ACP methyl ester carboxylesterase